MDFFALAVLCLLLAVVLVGVGFLLAHDALFEERQRLDQQRAALATEWQQLDRTRRIRAVFLAARREMQIEALRHSQRPPTNPEA